MKSALSDRKCQTLLKQPGKYSDGNNLWFVVSEKNQAKWVLRFTIKTRRREMGLGTYPQTSLKDARTNASEQLKLARRGIDPINNRSNTKLKASLTPTFRACADAYISNQRDGWRNLKHAQQWQNTINEYCTPLLDIPVDEITQDDVMRVLLPIWQVKNETASRLRGRIERVLGYATAAKYREGANPAVFRGSLEFLLPKVKRVVRHHSSLPWRDLPRFWMELESISGEAKDALRFLILTAARSDEVRAMTWSEINIKDAIWTVPANRIKQGITHEVPLSDEALAILEKQGQQKSNEFVFYSRWKSLNPTANQRPLADSTLSKIIMRLNIKALQEEDKFIDPDGREASVHGFRSTFRMWAAEISGFSRDVAEFALAHKLPDAVEAAYQRSTLFDQRKRLMSAWSTYAVKAKNVSS
jgi:integrase